MSSETQKRFQRQKAAELIMEALYRLNRSEMWVQQMPKAYQRRLATLEERTKKLHQDVLAWPVTLEERAKARADKYAPRRNGSNGV